MGIGTGYFAVCCIDKISTQVIDQFLTLTYDTSTTVDCDPRLVIISNLEDSSSEEPTQPPVPAFDSPFLQKSLQQVATNVRQLAHSENSNIDDLYFAMLDKRSETDGTALLAQINGSDDADLDVESLRASFEVVNYTLNSLNVGVTSFGEQQSRATDGVLEHPDSARKLRGTPAPRRKLGE